MSLLSKSGKYYSDSHSSEVQGVIVKRRWTQINADNFVLH
jgi:hypothetical protein